MRSLNHLRDRYRQCAIAMDEATDPDEANRFHDECHSSYRVLRETDEGRKAIMSLMSDPDRSVQCSAAAHSLQWWPDRARAVLEALGASGGVCSFEAKTVLEEFDKGSLTFDY